MESWENKILGDKLNSLKDLPAGYVPNLSSKWEIIEAGLPVAEKRRIAPLIIRWSVAAAVLAVVGLVWVNAGEEKEQHLTGERSAAWQQPFQDQPLTSSKGPVDSERFFMPQLSSEGIIIPGNKNAEQHNQPVYQPLLKAATVPVQEDPDQGSESSTAIMAKLSLPADSILPETLQPATASIALEEKPRPVRKRIYQRDFNDGTLVMDTGFAPASRQHFSVQLKPFSRKITDQGEEAAPRLQLKQVF